MSAKPVRFSMVVLCLLFATASWLSATSDTAAPQAEAKFWSAQPAFLAPAAVASCRLAGGGNCSDDSDCGAGEFCYHDPIALVPYCAPRGGQTIEFQAE